MQHCPHPLQHTHGTLSQDGSGNYSHMFGRFQVKMLTLFTRAKKSAWHSTTRHGTANFWHHAGHYWARHSQLSTCKRTSPKMKSGICAQNFKGCYNYFQEVVSAWVSWGTMPKNRCDACTVVMKMALCHGKTRAKVRSKFWGKGMPPSKKKPLSICSICYNFDKSRVLDLKNNKQWQQTIFLSFLMKSRWN